MRVTHNSIAANVLANLQGNINRMGETQQRLASGKQINKAVGLAGRHGLGDGAALRGGGEQAVRPQRRRRAGLAERRRRRAAERQ
jgi:hypothetical protein